MKRFLFVAAWLIAYAVLTPLCAQQLPAIKIPFPTTSEEQNKVVPQDAASGPSSGVYEVMKSLPAVLSGLETFDTKAARMQLTDTIFVGDVPGDTLIINGNFTNNGPVLVFNDGVLIIESANVTLLGDVYVFQNGRMLVSNSVLALPQQYFYQRGMIVANDGYLEVQNSTLDFSGLSHSLGLAHNAAVVMNNVTNIGFTTAAANGNASIEIDSTNLAGEYIMQDSCTYSFSNANTLLLWHQLPATAVINYSFPSNGTVASYQFNNLVPGVAGINYETTVTNCTDVMWALMPVNGSDVTVSNSALRVIGLWFMNNDTTNVTGLVNNSSYTSFTAPLTDRNLQLNNTTVQTWSLYVFDFSYINLSACIIGELGTMNFARADAQNLLCDGSGGYYWSADSSFGLVVNSTILGNLRSEENSILLFAYGSVSAAASAIGHSILVMAQSSIPQDPVPYEGGTVWFSYIDQPLAVFADSVVAITGSAWINNGPLGGTLDLGSYQLSYSSASTPGNWININGPITNEVSHALLGNWDTDGLTPGGYNIRLQTISNSGDSIEAIRSVTLLPSLLGLNENNLSVAHLSVEVVGGQPILHLKDIPSGRVRLTVYDSVGRMVAEKLSLYDKGAQRIETGIYLNSAGLYFIQLSAGEILETIPFFVNE